MCDAEQKDARRIETEFEKPRRAKFAEFERGKILANPEDGFLRGDADREPGRETRRRRFVAALSKNFMQHAALKPALQAIIRSLMAERNAHLFFKPLQSGERGAKLCDFSRRLAHGSRGVAGMRGQIFLHALQANLRKRTGFASGAEWPADILPNGFQMPMQFIKIVSSEAVRRRHHGIERCNLVAVRFDETETPHDTDDMRIGDESALAQRAEIQRRGRDLAAHATYLFQPDKRRLDIQIVQEFEIDCARAHADLLQSTFQIFRFFFRTRHAFEQRCNPGHGRIGQFLRTAIAIEQAHERVPGNAVVSLAADEAENELIYGPRPKAFRLWAKKAPKTLPHRAKVGRLAEREDRLHEKTLEHKENINQDCMTRVIYILPK